MRRVLAVLIIYCLYFTVESSRKNVCYWGTWSTYREGLGRFTIENIDPTLCTHFTYSFLGADDNGNVIHLDPHADLTLQYIERFVALRSRNPSAKFLLSLGGYSLGSAVFSRIAASPTLRATFAQSILDMINEFGFDGADLDWEWPGQREGSDPVNDRPNFVLLCAEIHRVLSAAGKEFGIAVAAAESAARISYDIPRVAANVDFINIMAYDFHGSWNNFTGIHAAMYAGPQDVTSFQRELNVHASVSFWLREGAPRSKIIVGMPTFGRSFTLRSASENAVGAAAVGSGNAGEFLSEQGFLGYNEICRLLRAQGWTRRWESSQNSPYAFNGNQWVGYDDLESIRYKLLYVRTNNLGGSMWWSLETDDFLNLCGDGFSPLIRLAQTLMTN